jgi:hypothetical protein
MIRKAMIRAGGVSWATRIAFAAATTTLLAVLLLAAEPYEPSPPGLRATYFANSTWSGGPALSAVDARPSTALLLERWHDSPPERFSVLWTGWLVVPREDVYTLATDSDDGSRVYLDSRLIVDNSGVHQARLARAAVRLTPGCHALLIDYSQAGGLMRFELLWQRGEGPLEPVPAWALRRRAATLGNAAASMAVDAARVLSAWLSPLLLLMAALLAAWKAARTSALSARADWVVLRWILPASAALNAVGLWWGLPARWAPDELSPAVVAGAWSQHFAHGWFDRYPPLHFYALSLVSGPAYLLDAVSGLDVHSAGGFSFLMVSFRLLSVFAAAGMVWAACVCGTLAFGRRAGLLAAGWFSLIPPFVYYAKTANVDVPWIFWWSMSMVFYLRIMDDGRLRDYGLFAACAAFAVCTKDQAYALYLILPLVILHRLWLDHRRGGDAHAIRAALLDPRFGLAALTASVLFAICDGLLFNFGGFIDHVRFITGPGNTPYRFFERTPAGYWALLRLTATIAKRAVGWPLLLLAFTGVAIAVATPRRRRVAWLLALPIATYFLGFVCVILYNYDRFMLPACFVLALFAGLACDVLLRWSSGRGALAQRVGVGLVCLAFGYNVLYATTLDALMIRDSRYVVAEWMASHVAPDDVVGTSGPLDLLPRLDRYSRIDIGSTSDLESAQPRFYLLNADYAVAVPPDTQWGRILAGLKSGILPYRLEFQVRRPSPLAWLPGAHPDLVGSRQETTVTSVLRNINPTIRVYERVPVRSQRIDSGR